VLWGYPVRSLNHSPSEQLLNFSGAGKSVLSANLVEDLRKGHDLVVLYFFFRVGDVKAASALKMLASITAQLI
jgi:hypothetical protein